jgi:hypothetical protein
MRGRTMKSKDLKQLFKGVPEEDLKLIKNTLARFFYKVHEEGE